mmetsp:Transcript_11599/g.32677  ORF Transcript_11599/g.32677 Transcript_11599/m.32677 type:complete len:399 (+) Transcript_11599:591-1787(+)
MPQAHDDIHHLIDPSSPGILVPSWSDAGLAARLRGMLPTQNLSHTRKQRRGVETTEAQFSWDLHETQEPAGCEAEAQAPGGVQGGAEGALAEAEALGVDVGLQRLGGSLYCSCAACGNPMLHHHDLCGKVEHQLVSHSFAGGLPRRHVLQDPPHAVCVRHGQLLRRPLQGAVRQHLECGAEDDAQPAERDRGRIEVGLAPLDLADAAVVEHEAHGQQVLGMTLPQVVTASGYAAAHRVGGVPWRHTQRQSPSKESVLQLPHLHPGLRLDLKGFAICASLAAGPRRHHHLYLLESEHIYHRPLLLIRRTGQIVEAVARCCRTHRWVPPHHALQLCQRARPLDDDARSAGELANPVDPLSTRRVQAEDCELLQPKACDNPTSCGKQSSDQGAAANAAPDR